MRRFLSRLLGRATSPARRPRSNKGILQVEALENRLVPTVSLDPVSRDIIIDGTDGSDVVSVRLENGQFKVRVNNDPTRIFEAGEVTGGDVFFTGKDGNDRFENFTSLRTTADGGRGIDILAASPNADVADVLIGGLGEDFLYGYGGDDQLWAVAPNVFADVSVNHLFGGKGNDTLEGSTLADAMFGEQGTDSLSAYGGNDHLDGGVGNDFLHGHEGNDTLVAGPGLDTEWNFLDGGKDNDTMTGDNGIDFMHGGDGNDTLDGRGGNDDLDGGSGSDTLRGGTGHDVLYSARGIVGDFSFNHLDGGYGNDTLIGGDGGDYMLGSYGNDSLFGGAGGDVLHGEYGDDYLDGGADGVADELFGGAGHDYFKKDLSLGQVNIDFPNDSGFGGTPDEIVP